MMYLPWQESQWQHLLRLKETHCIPHGLLFVGSAGIGKRQFTQFFTRALLCEHDDVCTDTPCHACRMIEGEVHPNVLWVEPEKVGHAIKVEQIRALTEFSQQSAFQGKYKVIVIHPANQMNVNAANALLKTLEEPTAGTIIILLSDQQQGMPATILSRVQRVVFSKPAMQQGVEWLKQQLGPKAKDIEQLLRLANGAPYAALQWLESGLLKTRALFYDSLIALSQQKMNAIHAAAELKELELPQLLDFLFCWLMDLLKLQMGAETIVNLDYKLQLQQLAQASQAETQTDFLSYLQQLRRHMYAGINLNKLLTIEEVLIRWEKTYAVS